MGYLTQFELTFKAPKYYDRDYLPLFHYNKIISERLSHGDDVGVYISNEPIKWYDHEDDLKEVSEDYPEFLLVLTGIGENPGDMWVKYFKNGYMEYYEAELSYPKFKGARS